MLTCNLFPPGSRKTTMNPNQLKISCSSLSLAAKMDLVDLRICPGGFGKREIDELREDAYMLCTADKHC